MRGNKRFKFKNFQLSLKFIFNLPLKGLPFRVYLAVLFFITWKQQHYVTSTVTKLNFFHWCKDKHGDFIAHPLKCSKFIRCSHDQAYVFQCPAKLRWNQAIKACDWEHRTKCVLDDTKGNNKGKSDALKKSVKRDTSRHKDYGTSFESIIVTQILNKTTIQHVENLNVTEYPLNSNTNDDVLRTTFKSLFKTPPCNENTKSNSSALNSANNISDNVKETESAHGNNFESKTSMDTVELNDILIKNATSSKGECQCF